MMKNISRPVKSIAASLSVVGLLAFSQALPVHAAADTGVTITGGSLSGGALTFANFTPITLGTDTTATSTWAIANVTDARGSGAGWHLSLSLSQLTEYLGAAYIAGGKTIPTGSIKVTTAPIVALVGSTGSASTTVTPVSANTALDTGSAVTLASAAADGGMGTYSFSSMTATLTVPANVYAKLYKSDATVSVTTAP
ncbi:MAG: hypothetical protein JWO59_1761 [Chloroflexi bacterium]|nr:hypothetical protein [Chloroflexota bacterium]